MQKKYKTVANEAAAELIEKKSRFIASVCPVETEAQALEFLERIRDEKKFNSLDELKQQLKNDTKKIYEKYICKSN